MSALRLLIADDESNIRQGLLKLIDWPAIGYQVDGVFSDGQEVIDYLEKQEADVLLADIVMFKVSGLEAAAWIRENRPEMKVLLLTSYSEFRYAQQAVNLGVYHFFTKPVDPDHLKEIFSALSAQLRKDPPVSAEETPESEMDLLFSALDGFLKDHFRQGVTLESAARFVHLSSSYLSRLFKSKKGMNFSSYVFSLRISEACRLLTQTDLLIYEIAEKVGYRDVRHFMQVFRKETGRSPSSYRRFTQLHKEDKS